MIEVLYVDSHIVVCIKPTGVISQEGGEQSMVAMLKEQLQADAVYPIHRLDKAVSGVMVYGLTQRAAAGLSRAVQERTLEKTYLAVLRGRPEQSEGDLEDLLFHDKTKNKTYVVDRLRKGVKPAKLSYKVLANSEENTLVKVLLHTGRTHQIRVQFASRKLPLVGDGRYGAKSAHKELGLCSCGLKFLHPVTGKTMAFWHTPPQSEPWQQFTKEIYEKESRT